jgi:thioredoxin 1
MNNRTTHSTISPSLPAVTAATFDSDVLAASSDRTVVVDFSAEWCGPCRMLAPVLANIAAQPDVGAKFVAVDADTETDLVSRFGIRALPTLLFFRDGKVADQLVGLNSAQTIRARISSVADRAA